MSTGIIWNDDATALISVDDLRIVQLQFTYTPLGWGTTLLHNDKPVDGSRLSLTVSGEEESDLYAGLVDDVAAQVSPGVTEAMRAAWESRARFYREESKELAVWGAKVRARAYARRGADMLLSAAFEELERMDRGACQGCGSPIDWHDTEPGYHCETCGEEQRPDPIQAVLDDLHPNLPKL